MTAKDRPGTIFTECEGPIGWIVFDNQPRLNAATLAMQSSIPATVAALEQNDNVRVVVVRGAGLRAFIAGADISEFETVLGSTVARDRAIAIAADAHRAIARCNKPTIAMIAGHCSGGGLGTAADCDIRIAADSARFSIQAARLGIGYPVEAVEQLAAMIGVGAAADLFLTARQIDADEALRLRLVSRVVPVGEIEAVTRALAQDIAALAPLALASVKASFRALQSRAEDDRRAAEEGVRRCYESEDLRVGWSAFLARTRAEFRGR